MACLKMEVGSDDEQMFDLKPTVTIKTEEEEDTKDFNINNVKTEGFGDVITIAPLEDLQVKDEPVNMECDEVVSVQTTQPKTSCQLGSAQDTDTQPVEPRRATSLAHQTSPSTLSRSPSTEAEPVKKISTGNSRPILQHQRSMPMSVLCRMNNLLGHGKFHKKVTQKSNRHHQCHICGKGFTESSTMKKHLLTHTGEKPHKCQICGRRFTQSSSLNRHLLTHTGEKPHKCKLCDKGFTQSSDLNRHLLSHTGEKPRKCKLCGKGFTQSSDLNRHLLSHKHKKPHKCHICGKAFIFPGDLTQHMLRHTGERPHKYMSPSLKQNLLNHTGEKPHKCLVSGKSYASSHSSRQHSLTQTDTKPHIKFLIKDTHGPIM